MSAIIIYNELIYGGYMRLNINDKEKVKKYWDFFYNHPSSSFYQDKIWALIKNGWNSDYFYIEKNNEVIAVAQVLSIYNSEAKKNLFYCPRGPVSDLYDIETNIELINEIKNFAKKNNGFLVKFDPNYEYDEKLVNEYKKHGIEFCHKMYSYVQFPFSMMLDINGRKFEDVIQSFSKNGRKQVRKSYKQDLELYVGNRDDIKIFHEITADMCKRKGITYRPIDYYYRLYDNFKDKARMTFVKYKNEFLSCSFLITFKDYAMALYGADNLNIDLGQSYFLDAEEIRYCCENNIRYYDLGGVKSLDINDGLYRFKRKFTNNNIIKWIGNIECIIDEDSYQKFIENKDDRDYTPELKGNIAD